MSMRFILALTLAAAPAHAVTCVDLFKQTLHFARASERPSPDSDLVDAFVKRGLRRGFATRQLAALVLLRRSMNLKLFDLAGAEYRRFARADPNPRFRHLDQHGGERGGVSYITHRGRKAIAVIAVDAASPEYDFADTLMEEILHLRLRHQWAGLEFDNFQPFIFTEAGLGLRQMLDEFVAKDLLAVYGRGRPRDREVLLAELLNDVERRAEDGVDGYVQLAITLLWCANEHGTTWRRLSASRLLTCLYRIGPGGPGRLEPQPDESEVLTLIRIAYAVNQRLDGRVKKRPDTPED